MPLIAGPRRALLTPRALRGEQYVRSLAPAAWFRKGAAVVGTWPDASGNARDMTLFNAPTLNADGTVAFNGVNQYGKTPAFALNQPETVYPLFKQVSWTNNDGIFDGNTSGTGLFYQNGVTPDTQIFAGTVSHGTPPAAIGTYVVGAFVFNAAASVSQINLTSTTVGSTIGAANMGGFTLGCWGDNTKFGNIQVAEVIIFAAAHSAAQRETVIRYLASVGSVELDS